MRFLESNQLYEEAIKSLAVALPDPYLALKPKAIICTVGIISKEKGQLTAIYAVKELVNEGYNVHWCFVGTGADLDRCQETVKAVSLENHVTFAGMQMNPYPWMKNLIFTCCLLCMKDFV